jgi:hypothetical protein
MRYQVKWGTDVAVFDAVDVSEAWVKFCHTNDRAARKPTAFEREITQVEVVNAPALVEVEECPPQPKTSKRESRTSQQS